MKVTIKDCLGMPSFRGAKVEAGCQYLDKIITGVSFLALSEAGQMDVDLHQEGEILLAPVGFGKGEGPGQLKLLAEMSKKGTAALVLFPDGQNEQGVAPDLCSQAESCGIPIILLAQENHTIYSQLVNEVMENVLYGDHFANRLISNTIFHLLNFERHSNFQSAVREAAINNNFQLVILSEDFNPVFSVETRHRATIADAIREAIERDVDKSKVYTKIDIKGALTYWGPVRINQEKHYMFIVDNEDSYSPGEITKLAEIVEIAMNMWKYSPVRDAKAEFLKALKRGNRSLAYSLKEEADISGKELYSVFCIEGLEKDSCLKKISAFEKQTNVEVMKLHENEEIFGIVLRPSRAKPGEQNISFYEEIASDQGILFHVTGVDGVEGAADGFQLINETCSLIKGIFPKKNLFSKYELALAGNCIDLFLKNSGVYKNYMDLLSPFKLSAEGKGRQLLETLEIFVLDAGMNTSKTAAMMGIHSNTVQYRLKRIKEILQADMMSTTVMPGLTMALAIERMEKLTKNANN